MIKGTISLSAGLLISLTALAHAQSDMSQCSCDPLVVMIDDGQRSDVICPAADTRASLLETWGAIRPEGARLLVIRKATGTTAWAPADATPEALAAEAGTVAVFTGSAADRAACFAAGTLCNAPQRNALGAIQPRDGVWRSTIGEMTFTGCPAQITGALSRSVPATLGMAEERRTFSDPFHPDSLVVADGQSDLAWQARPEGGWQTDFVPEAINDQQATGASTHVYMSLDVSCDTQIEGQTEIVVELPDVAKALLGVGPQGCRIERPFQLRWVGE